MSKKATHVQAASQPQAQATASADSAVAADAAAVVRATTAEPVKTSHDEHHGQGGHYEMRDGKRVLVQRTEPQA